MMRFFLAMLLPALMFFPTVAGFEKGNYFSYAYVLAKSDGETVSGEFSLSVLDVLPDGRLRLRGVATFNDGVATFEKNLPQSYFSPPAVDLAAYEGVYSFRRGNVSLRISVDEIGQELRAVSGFEFVTKVYHVSASADNQGESTRLEGVIEIIASSKVVYSLDLAYTGSGQKTASFKMSLKDTNIDLSAFNTTATISPTSFTATPASFFSAFPSSSVQFFDTVGQRDVVQEQATLSSAYFDRAGVVLAAGLATIGAVSFLSMRRKGRAMEPGEKKAHYV
uniref:Uncharacterized protein n=1 Tax=Caldiarchaeum subterraneum TaxID=311458 RepID=E6NAA1_CALS0|nr:hypothetical protein HGMM_F07G12C25 [Candidatus Caldarchaeum subterraneum]